MKAEFVDTRFCYRGGGYFQDCILDNCYKCPSCNLHVFEYYILEHGHCPYCHMRLEV